MGKEQKIKVIELFAGVGGFRLGLEGWQGKSSISGYKKKLNSNYEIVWSNQYEPSTKNTQHASEVYQSHWNNSNHSNLNVRITFVFFGILGWTLRSCNSFYFYFKLLYFGLVHLNKYLVFWFGAN